MTREELEKRIRESSWWRKGENQLDPHHSPEAGVTLTDHLERVRRNLDLLRPGQPFHSYFDKLQDALAAMGLPPLWVYDVLAPVALLHDLGKLEEAKEEDTEHPLTGKLVKKYHPILSIDAALEAIPEDYPDRKLQLNLVEMHDWLYAWYKQFEATGQIPKRSAWARMDKRLTGSNDGEGIAMLAVFKMADVDGHDNVYDSVWNVKQANRRYLEEMGRALPEPPMSAMLSLPFHGAQ